MRVLLLVAGLLAAIPHAVNATVVFYSFDINFTRPEVNLTIPQGFGGIPDVLDVTYGTFDSSGLTTQSPLVHDPGTWGGGSEVARASGGLGGFVEFQFLAPRGGIAILGFDFASRPRGEDIATGYRVYSIESDLYYFLGGQAFTIAGNSTRSIIGEWEAAERMRFEWGPDAENVGLDRIFGVVAVDLGYPTPVIPVPAPAALLFTAVVGLVLVRRRRPSERPDA